MFLIYQFGGKLLVLGYRISNKNNLSLIPLLQSQIATIYAVLLILPCEVLFLGAVYLLTIIGLLIIQPIPIPSADFVFLILFLSLVFRETRTHNQGVFIFNRFDLNNESYNSLQGITIGLPSIGLMP